MPQPALSERPTDAKPLRRAFVRYRCDQPTARRVFLVESYEQANVEIHDLSCGGVGLVFSQPLVAGTLLFIDLMRMDVPVEFLAHVVHATARPDGRFIIGCRFDQPLSPEEFALALDCVARREEA